jgi:predicted nuclease of predicted toxin-antitoxin system
VSKIQFHLDESIDPDVAKALRHHGLNVSTSREAGLLGQSDETQLGFARRQQRVIVTHDPDFLRYASSGIEHCGIAYCHKTALSIGEIIEALILIHEVLTPEEMTGHVEYL